MSLRKNPYSGDHSAWRIVGVARKLDRRSLYSDERYFFVRVARIKGNVDGTEWRDQWLTFAHDNTESIVISSIVISVSGRTRADLRPRGTRLASLLPLPSAVFLHNI